MGETLQMQKPRYVRTGNILIFHRKQADQEKVKAVAFVTFFLMENSVMYTSRIPLDNTDVYCKALQKQLISLNIANTLFTIHGSRQIPTLKQSYLNCSTGCFIIFLFYVSCYLLCMISHSFADISFFLSFFFFRIILAKVYSFY